jgi:peroxiredoxin
MKLRLPLAALGLLVGAGLLQAQTPATVPASADAPPARIAGPKPGDLAPDFTVVGPDGKELRLSDFRGKLVLLDIWATWCGPCIASMPHHSEVAAKHAKDDLIILAVCASDTRENYDAWVKRNGAKYAFRTAHDPAGRDYANSVFSKAYGVSGFPTLFMIGRDGRIVGSTTGGGQGENPLVTRLLAKAGVPVATAHLPPEPAPGAKMIGMGSPQTVAGATKTAAVRVPTATFGSAKYGDVIADFSAIGVDGREVKLSSFRGKPVLVAFWTGARNPGDDVGRLHATYKDQGLAVWAINVATERAQFDTWAKDNAAALGYTVSWDPAGKAIMEAISSMRFGVGMYPAYLIVNAEGEMRGGMIGMGPKVAGWLRQSLARADVKLTADDSASVKTLMDELFAAARSAPAGTAAAPAPGSTVPAGRIVPPPGGAAAAPPRPQTLAVGAVAPDFVMRDVNDKELRLSDFKDKVVVLDFWATWCGPCIASFPHTQDIAARYKDQGVVVLASGTSDTIAKFKEWIPKNQPKYPDMIWAFDPNERGSATFEQRASSRLFGVTGIPTQFVIGRDGKVAAVIVGNGGKDDARTEAALASVGVKVDPAVLSKGKEQLAKSAADEQARAKAAAEEETNPRPRFRESYGSLKAGSPVPDLVLEDAGGKPVSLSELSRGKTVVLAVWSARGFPAGEIATLNGWADRYASQGLLMVGLAAYGSRADFDAWRAGDGAKATFPVLFDPAGTPPSPPKASPDEMTDAEKEAFRAATRAHYAKVAPMKFAGGVMAPIPNTTVIDSQGRMVGFYVGSGPLAAESLGNLLLRAGIKLTPEDTPKRIFTAQETKEAPPEPKVERLNVGALAPDFVTQDLAGREVKLSDYKGKVVVLDFWATWCGPCMAAMPHTQEVAAKYKDQGVVVLGSCTRDDRAKFEAWVKANQAKYPDIIWSHDAAERGTKRASYALYGVAGIPTQFIVGRDGRVVDVVVGYLPGEVILDGALAKAGIKVDPAIVEKAAADLKRRG